MTIRACIGIVLFLIVSSCTHVQSYQKKEHVLSKKISDPVYNNIKNELIKTNAIHLKECNCMVAFHRDLFDEPDGSARYVFDKKVAEHALATTKGRDSVSVLAIGSGLLLNELTALAQILAQKKNLKIYLTDWAYLFYGEPNFEEKALAMGKNPDLLPEGYTEFYYWQWAREKNKTWPFLPFFKMYHDAIDEFKVIIANLDRIYGTQSTVEIIKPPAEAAVTLPRLDLIISIDAFTDLPYLLRTLLYQFTLANNSVRFVALNKLKPLGGFWETSGSTKVEPSERNPVNIHVYDVTSKNNFGSYKLIEHVPISPSEKQEQRANVFRSKPRRDPTESPLDYVE